MITVTHSPETEAHKLVIPTMEEILDGFFTHNYWYVMEVGTKVGKGVPAVFIPKLDYPYLLKYPKHMWIKKFAEEIEKTGNFCPIPKKKFQKIEHEYRKAIEPLIEKTKNIFPDVKNMQIDVEILISNYGTWGSFHLAKIDKEKKRVSVVIMPRMDISIEELQSCYVYSIVRSPIEKARYLKWREKQAIGEYFAEHVFKIDGFCSALNRIEKRDKKLFKKSIKFLMECGLPIGSPLAYNPETNIIEFNGKDISQKLAPYEFRFLKSIIQNSNRTTSYYQLSEDLYNSQADVRFSMWGINKTAQRVKDKLEDIGLPREAVYAVKGEGYKLIV